MQLYQPKRQESSQEDIPLVALMHRKVKIVWFNKIQQYRISNLQ